MADSITQIETSSQVGDGNISSQLVAPPPFNKPTADAVLRSCDGIDFYVVKAIMAEASSVFEDMFALPQPPPGPAATSGCGAGTSPLGGDPNLADDDGRIIRMTERSTIIEHVLRFVYPVDHPTIVHLEDVFDVLEMGTKFMIDCVVNGAKSRYETLAKQDPLKAYAIACKRQDHSGIHVAVKACLSRPIPTADNYIVELEDLSAGAYIRLQKYHHGCSLAIKALNVNALEYDHKEVPWIKSSIGYAFCWMTTVTPITPQGYRGVKQKFPAQWWVKCMKQSLQDLNVTPHPDTANSPIAKARFIAAGIHAGVTDYRLTGDVNVFLHKFANVIQEKLDTVQFTWPSNVSRQITTTW